MYKKKLFIGGPITSMIYNNIFDEQYKGFVNEIIENTKYKFEILSAYIEEDFGRYILKDDVETTKRDLSWIDNSDACVFLLPFQKSTNTFSRSDGMFVELGYALNHGCKIYLLCDLVFWNNLSPMIKGMSGIGVKFMDINEYPVAIEELIKGEMYDI